MVSDKTDTVVFIIGSIKTEPHAPSQRFLEDKFQRETVSCSYLKEKKFLNRILEKKLGKLGGKKSLQVSFYFL